MSGFEEAKWLAVSFTECFFDKLLYQACSCHVSNEKT